MIWLAVLGCAAGCYLLKLAGMSVPERALTHPVVRRSADLLPVVLLAALVAVQVNERWWLAGECDKAAADVKIARLRRLTMPLSACDMPPASPPPMHIRHLTASRSLPHAHYTLPATSPDCHIANHVPLSATTA